MFPICTASTSLSDRPRSLVINAVTACSGSPGGRSSPCPPASPALYTGTLLHAISWKFSLTQGHCLLCVQFFKIFESIALPPFFILSIKHTTSYRVLPASFSLSPFILYICFSSQLSHCSTGVSSIESQY